MDIEYIHAWLFLHFSPVRAIASDRRDAEMCAQKTHKSQVCVCMYDIYIVTCNVMTSWHVFLWQKTSPQRTGIS